MNRVEFIEKLQRALAGGLGSSLVTDNVRYYQEYIDEEMRRGKSEAEVLNALGDPRLLAKSIIEANKRAGINEGTNRVYDEEMSGRSSAYDGSAYDGGTYGSGNGPYSGGAYSGDGSYGSDDAYGEPDSWTDGRKVTRVPGWLVMLIVTVVVVLIIGVAFSVLSFFSPVIIFVLAVLLFVKLFQGKK